MKFDLMWQYDELEDMARFRDKFRAYVRDFYLGNITDLDSASGYSLDLIGKILGFDTRPAVSNASGFVWNQSLWNNEDWNDSQFSNVEVKNISDGLFRKVLQVRARQQYERRTIKNLLSYLDSIFDNLTYTYTNDIKDVIISYDSSSVTMEEQAVLDSGFILPPQGCTIEFIGV